MVYRTINFVFLISLSFSIFQCTTESSNNDSAEITIDNQFISNSLANGSYIGSLKSDNHSIVDFIFYSTDSNAVQKPIMSNKKSLKRLMVNDSVAFWDPWIEHSGSYGTFVYDIKRDSSIVKLSFKQARNIILDFEELTFHHELFEQDFQFTIGTLPGLTFLSNEQFEMRLNAINTAE